MTSRPHQVQTVTVSASEAKTSVMFHERTRRIIVRTTTNAYIKVDKDPTASAINCIVATSTYPVELQANGGEKLSCLRVSADGVLSVEEYV